ncbi:melatonin receptor type 1A-like [Amphiura filiformis]|uniref:melatonin receptor type 1A-like n=1 Tax=Amphiura filiformis TaxID=82378 RepID=UPI003B216ED1
MTTLNNANDDEPPLNPTDTTAYLICKIVLLIIGACGNILLITSVLTVKKLRTLDHAFVFNLVVADSLALVLLDVLGIIGIIADEGHSPLAIDSRICKAVSFFCLSACICSVWSVASCGLYIYMRVCHKALFDVFFTPQIVTVMIFWLWTLCPMIVLPSMMGWGTHGFDSRLMHCTYDPYMSLSFTYFMLTLGAWAPMSITIYCLGRTVSELRNQAVDVNPPHAPTIHVVITGDSDSPPPPPPLNISTRGNINTMRSVMSVSFYIAIAWVTMSTIWIHGGRKQLGDVQFVFSMVLAHSPCCFNGLIYALTNEDFREAYWKSLTFCRRCGEDDDHEGPSDEGVAIAHVQPELNSPTGTSSRRPVVWPTLPSDGAVLHQSPQLLNTFPDGENDGSVYTRHSSIAEVD